MTTRYCQGWEDHRDSEENASWLSCKIKFWIEFIIKMKWKCKLDPKSHIGNLWFMMKSGLLIEVFYADILHDFASTIIDSQ